MRHGFHRFTQMDLIFLVTIRGIRVQPSNSDDLCARIYDAGAVTNN